MPLTPKGSKIMGAMAKEYGPKKGKQVFYASRNAGKIKGVDPVSMPKPAGFAPKRSPIVAKRAANNAAKPRMGLKNTVTDNDPMQKSTDADYP